MNRKENMGPSDDWADALQGLSPEELAALKAISLEGGTTGITVELCHQRINQITGKRRQDGAKLVQGLLTRGLVLKDRVNYREVYRLPAALAPALTTTFLRLMAERIQAQPEEATGSRQEERRLLWDLVRFLGFVAREEVRLTQTGQIFKRQAKEIAGQFLTPSSEAELPDSLGEPLDFVLSFCLEEGLVERGAGLLRVTPKAAEWLAASEGEVRLRMLEFWRRYLLAWHRDLDVALAVLAEAPAGAWLNLETLARELEPLMSPGFRGPVYPRLNRFLLAFLYRAGFLERTAPAPLGRLTPAGRAAARGIAPDPGPVEDTFLLQPNFEVLAPPYLERPLLWTLGLAADLVRADQMGVYRVGQDSIYRALSAGLSERQLLQFFQQHSRTGMPANVEQALRDWSSSFGRLRFERVSLLRCETADLAAWVMASPRTAPFVQGQYSPTDLLVHPDDVAALLEALRQDGHMPRPGVVMMPEQRRGQTETGPAGEAKPGT